MQTHGCWGRHVIIQIVRPRSRSQMRLSTCLSAGVISMSDSPSVYHSCPLAYPFVLYICISLFVCLAARSPTPIYLSVNLYLHNYMICLSTMLSVCQSVFLSKFFLNQPDIIYVCEAYIYRPHKHI